MSKKINSPKRPSGASDGVDRRRFLTGGAAVGVGSAAALAGLGTTAAAAHHTDATVTPTWDNEVDIVIIGAGPGGLSAAITAAEAGLSTLVVEKNFDIGGRAMMSSGNLYIGGGNRYEEATGKDFSADALFGDWSRVDMPIGRFSDRELVRTWADASLDLFNFFDRLGMDFRAYNAPGAKPDRLYREGRTRLNVNPWPNEAVTPNGGSGIVRPLEKAARRLGVQIMLQHKMTEIHRENQFSGPVTGITVTEVDDWFQPLHRTMTIRARHGVVVATGGSAGNVPFRTMFDVRLTEEYQAENAEWVERTADGEIAAMAIGAALGGTGNQTTEDDHLLNKGRLGKKSNGAGTTLYPTSPHFFRAGAVGLQVGDWQNLILVKENGLRFYDETVPERDYGYFAAALDWTGDPNKMNGGGPIWAIFDADAVEREGWDVTPPHVDTSYFFSADTIEELATKVERNEYQWRAMPSETLVQTVERYNSFVESGVDEDFGKPTPLYKIENGPFYAAWCTPVIHDTFTGVRINKRAQVVDLHGEIIPGLYACGDSSGGFGQHGIARAATFGRIAAAHVAEAAGAVLGSRINQVPDSDGDY